MSRSHPRTDAELRSKAGGEVGEYLVQRAWSSAVGGVHAMRSPAKTAAQGHELMAMTVASRPVSPATGSETVAEKVPDERGDALRNSAAD